MSYNDSYKLIVEFFVTLAESEKQIEQVRYSLNKCYNFNPYLLFNKLDQYRRGYLTEENLIEFSKAHGIKATINQVKFLLFFYDTDYSKTLTFHEFLNLVLCREFLQTTHNYAMQNSNEYDYISNDIEIKFIELLKCEYNLIKIIEKKLSEIKSDENFSVLSLISYIANNGNYITIGHIEGFLLKNNVNIQKESLIGTFKRLDIQKLGRVDLANLERIFYFSYSSSSSNNISNCNSALNEKKEEQKKEYVKVSRNNNQRTQWTKKPQDVKINNNCSIYNSSEINDMKSSNEFIYKQQNIIKLIKKNERTFIIKNYSNKNLSYYKKCNTNSLINSLEDSNQLNSFSYLNTNKEILNIEPNFNKYKPTPLKNYNIINSNQDSILMNYEKKNISNTLNLKSIPKRIFTSVTSNKIFEGISDSNFNLCSISPQKEKIFTEDKFVSFLLLIMDIERERETRKIEILCNQPDFNMKDLFILFKTPTTKNDLLAFGDFKQGLHKLGLSITDEDIKVLLLRFDSKREGGISYSNLFDIFVPFEKENRDIIEKRKNCGNLSQDTLNLIKDFIVFILDSEEKIENYRVMLNNLNGFSIQKIYSEQLDKNKKGFVINEDLKNYLTRKGVSYEQRDVDLFFIRFDINKDGKITYDNFLNEITPILG